MLRQKRFAPADTAEQAATVVAASPTADVVAWNGSQLVPMADLEAQQRHAIERFRLAGEEIQKLEDMVVETQIQKKVCFFSIEH